MGVSAGGRQWACGHGLRQASKTRNLAGQVFTLLLAGLLGLSAGCGTPTATPAADKDTATAADTTADGNADSGAETAIDTTPDSQADSTAPETTDAAVGTDGAAISDTSAETDTAASTDAMAGTDGAGPETDSTSPTGSDVTAQTDTTADTDTTAQTDGSADTDAATQTDTATGGTDATAPVLGSLQLKLVGTEGSAPQDAVVRLNGVELAMEVSGSLYAGEVAAGEYTVVVEAQGYAPAAKVVTIATDKTTQNLFVLTPVSATATFLSTADTEVTVGDVQLALPADAFVDAAGLPFAGTVTVLFAPTGPTAAELAGAPGPLVGTPSGGDGPQVLSAAFLADIRFVAPDGSGLQLAAGKTATLTYVLPETLAQLYATGQTLGGWFFDLDTATWQQQGESIVQEDPLTGAKSVQLAVGHFSWWLIATGAKAASCVRVTVTEDGVPKANAIIQVLGLYAQGYEIGSSGADGSSCIVAPVDTDVLVQVADFYAVQTGGGQMVHTSTTAASCGEATGCVEVQVALVGPKACADVAVCDDSNTCTVDACASGQCIHYQKSGGPCDDGNSCTTQETCLGGACAGQLAVCNDNNPCTNDICQNGKGCVYSPNTATCDDGDDCTLGDTCSNATCGAGGPKDCDDDNVCTVDLCEAPSGTCAHTPVPGDCNDNTPCTAGDKCTDGICAGLANADLCDDGNVCTTDACNLLAQSCVNMPAGGPCDDGDVCSGGDACVEGTCIAQGQKPANYVDQQFEVDYLIKWSPNENNALWQKVFFDQTLTHGRLLSVEMSLGLCGVQEFPGTNFTLQLYEEMGGLQATSAAVPFASLPTSCTLTALESNQQGPTVFGFGNKGAPIVAGKAYWLVLVHTAVQCQQGCAAELQASAVFNDAIPAQGAVYVALGGQLPPQTTGLRMAFKTAVVDDLNVLTNGTSCDDGIDCTVGDACLDGTCQGTASCDDGLACTLDACETTGCQHTPNDALCEDDDACSTVDTCDTTEGCVYTGALADGETCTDGNLCTVSGSCLGGKCVVVDKDCEDGDFCTINYCDRKYGSGNCASDSANCDDGNDCTADFCTNGACAPEVINQAIQCNDGFECTWYATCQAGVCTPSGGSTCQVGDACAFDAGCESEKCVDGLCAFSTCHDKVLSGDESDVDCGGTCTKKCAALQKCNVQEDCDQAAYNKYCSASQGICWSNPN